MNPDRRQQVDRAFQDAQPQTGVTSRTSDALSLGTTLGPYEVIAKIGEGGMGEVYKARDAKLDRDVALKVLPQAFTDDPDRLARFEREAKVLASLNHPNIGGIYGFEEHAAEGVKALVLEYTEGPTLADRIAQSAIPIEDALPIARQIAEALEAAHEAGIIHRDLKPANIKLKPDGTVKVLDFGLAKALDRSPEGDPSQSRLLTNAATATGVIMGTATYMSPEQAKGKSVDKRTDVWAFGCVVYEMLTGRRAFAGETVSETLASVLTRDADLTALPGGWPQAGHRLLRRCLEREPRRRLRDVVVGVLEVEEELEHRVSSPVAAVTPARGLSLGRRAWPALGLVAAAVVAGLTGWHLRPAPPLGRVALAVTLPAEVSLPGEMRIVAALSPAGRDLVYVGHDGTTTHLYHRPLDQVDATQIADTEGAENPFFSPDGRWVGFKVDDTLRKAPLAGGRTETVFDFPENPFEGRWRRGAAWDQDDMIWFGDPNTGLYQVAAAGGVPQLVTTVPFDDVRGHSAPQPLPGGRAILYTAHRGSYTVDRDSESSTPSSVALYIPDTGEHRMLAEGERAWFASSGHVVFSRSGTLWALPFDTRRLEATGAPIRVREDVRVNARGVTQSYLGADGTLAYVPDRGTTGPRTLVWVDREGNEQPILIEPRSYRSPRLSPDETRVAVAAGNDAGYDVWVYDLERGSEMRLTDSPGEDFFPVWTPDGERVVYYSGSHSSGLAWKAADGTGEAEPLVSDPEERMLIPQSVSPDGRSVLFTQWDALGPTGLNLGVVTMDGDYSWDLVRATEYAETSAVVSPDGRWLVYQSNDSGRFEIYVTPFPEVDSQRVQVSTAGGQQPVWSPAGDELFYRQPIDCGPDSDEPDAINDIQEMDLEGCEKTMMVAQVETAPTFSAGTPETLFADPYYAATGTNYSVSGDGQRFLMIKHEETLRELTIITNWVEALSERVPSRP